MAVKYHHHQESVIAYSFVRLGMVLAFLLVDTNVMFFNVTCFDYLVFADYGKKERLWQCARNGYHCER